MSSTKKRPEPAPLTDGLTDLDRDRAASVADEGGGSAAHVESEKPATEVAGPAPRADGPDTRRSNRSRGGGKRRAFSLVLAALLLPGAAQAETYLTPFAGLAFSGDTDDSKLTWGGQLTFAPADGGIGFNVDFARTPDFFGTTRFLDNSVTSLTGNLVVMSSGPTRIYAVAGGGLLKTSVSDASGLFDIDSNDFGIDVGAGIVFGGQGPLGLQADIRYFRALQDPEPDDEFDVDFGELDYWRATAGLSIRF